MPRTTNFRLTQEEEQKTVDYLILRKGTLLSDNKDRVDMDKEAWDRYQLDVNRRQSDQGSIWPLSNIPIPVFPMVIEHFVSRCEDSTTGDEPYFSFDPVGGKDRDKALVYDNYFNWKFKQGKIHDKLLEAHLPSFLQKAHILKAVYDRQEASWIDFDKTILFNIDPETKQTGAAVDWPNHGPIIQGEDEFIDQPDPIAAAHADPEGVASGAVQIPMRQHLKADPTFVLNPNVHRWAPATDGIKRRKTIYAGAKTENVPSDRFYMAMDAEGVQETDVTLELQDRNLNWIGNNWIDRPWARWSDWKTKLDHGDASAKTEKELQTDNRIQREPENRGFDNVNPVRKILEFWVRRDVKGDGDGTPQEFVIFIDEATRTAIFYEWWAKVCPDMRRPYSIIAISKLPNRWHGKSIYEKGRDLFTAIDRMWNGEFYRTLQQANPPKGGDKTVAIEEPDTIEHNPSKFYELHPGKDINMLLQYAKIPDTNGRSQMLLEYMVFWIQLWLGISNLAQGDYQAVNTNTTKYGIAKTLEQSSMLGRRWIRRVIAAIEDNLTKLVMLTVATMPQNAQETFEYAEGDQRIEGTLSGGEIRSLNMHVELVLGQSAEKDDIDRCNTAIEFQQKYFGQLNPEVRQAMRPLILECLQMLGFKNEEELLPDSGATPVDKSAMGGEGHRVLAAAAGGAGPAAIAAMSQTEDGKEPAGAAPGGPPPAPAPAVAPGAPPPQPGQPQ